MARFQETVNLQPQNLSTGFTQASNTLLNRLQQFGQASDALLATGQKLAMQGEAKAGQAEAEQALKEGKPFERKEATVGEKLLTRGVRADQYNKTLEAGYLAGLSNDAREAISAIEVENADNITQFNEKANGYVNGVLKTVDPSVHNDVAQYLDNQITNARIRVHEKTIKKNKADALAEASTAIDGFSNEAYTLSRQGDQTGAAENMIQAFTTIDALVEAGDIPIDKANLMKREIERESTEQVKRKEYDDLIDSEGVVAAFEKLEADKDEIPNGWTPDEWDTFMSSAQADIRQQAIIQGQKQAKDNSETSLEVSELKIKGSTGFDSQGNEIPPGDIIQQTNQMFANGQINGSTRSSVITSVINRQKKEVKDLSAIDKVSKKLAGAIEIPLEQSEVDTAWDSGYSQATETMTPTQKGGFVAQFINETKIIPTAVTAQIENNLNSGDVELIAESADLMARIDQIRGLPDDNFSANERAFAETVSELSLNMDAELAIKLAKDNTNPNDNARIEARKTLIKDEEFSNDYRSVVDDAYDPVFGFTRVDDISGDRLAKEYGSVFEQHFIAGMSEKKAKAKALEIIQRNWKESTVTGKSRVMKYAPEDYYAVEGDTSYIGRQLHREVKDNSFGLGEFTKEQIILQSDDRTSREASNGQPSYLVYVNSDDGLIPIFTKGAPARFVPDVNAEVKRRQALNKTKLEEGRKEDTLTNINALGFGGL